MELSSGGGAASTGAVVGSGPFPVQNVRVAVQDLFNLYLGRPTTSKSDAISREQQSSKQRRKMSATSRPQPPKDENFLVDYQELQTMFPETEQLRSSTEAVLAMLVVQCSYHALQVEFLLYALQTLTKLNLVRWDSFLPLLLRAVGSCEMAGLHQGPQATSTPASVASHMLTMGSSATPPMSTSTPASPAPPLSSSLIASPTHSAVDVSSNILQSSAAAASTNGSGGKMLSGPRVVTWLRPLVCKILQAALEAELKPVASYDVLVQIVSWINQWDPKSGNPGERQSSSKDDGKIESTAWLHNCVELTWALIDEGKCRVPFYALLHDRTQLKIDHWPEDELLFALFLEVHRRRDKIALHIQMLDQHLHCPTFATLRMTALTYVGNLGEPLHGEDIANAIPRGSLEWERALRCLRHALRFNPSADWWRKVLLPAPRYRQQTQSQPAPSRSLISSTQPASEFSADMTCEAVVDRILELMTPITGGSSSVHVSTNEAGRWQEWLIFADLFYFFMRSGYIDFLEFIDRLAARFARGDQPVMRSNHVTWLLAQVFRLETVTAALSSDSKKLETAQKILSFHMAERPVDQTTNLPPQTMLLDFVGSSQILRLWSINRQMMEQLTGNRMPEHIQKGKQIDEWWKQVGKGERVLDYSNLDDKSMGMVWVLSHTVSQPICEAVMAWLNSKGAADYMSPGQSGDRVAIIHETRPLPIVLLSGLSLHMSSRLINNIEDLMFGGQLVPSIGMVETYVRLLLVVPQTLFRHHVNGMMQRYQQGLTKPGVQLLLLELLNYRLIPLCRYQNKIKQLLFDIAKIIITVKAKRGEHRLFRLTENLGINLILSMREVILIKKELKGASTEFTETLNRVMVINLAITMKTRGIAEIDHMMMLQPSLEQILANSQHTWSEKTMRHFPPTLRDALAGRTDKRPQIIQQWQSVEATVMHHLRAVLSPAHDPSYALNALNAMNNFPQHRQYLCAGAWMLMDGHLDSINAANLGRLIKELQPEEVTTNIYTMVDVLLHNIQVQLQHGHLPHDLLLRASAGLAVLMWTHEILPFDITLLALADRDDDTHALRLVVGLLLDRPEFVQRMQHHCVSRGQQEHWMHPGPFQRLESQQALGQHLAGKDRYPIFFDEMSLRALPVIPLIIYRLIENDATETAERLLGAYQRLLFHHPAHFSFVRDILAYFYGSLPSKLIVRLLGSLDLNKIPFSEAFLQHVSSQSTGNTLPQEYYSNLLQGLVNKVIPPSSKSRTSYAGADGMPGMSRSGSNRSQTSGSGSSGMVAEVHKAFYQHQDPGTYSQLVLETAVVELLSLPPPSTQAVTMLVNVAVRVPSPPSHSPTGSTGLVGLSTVGTPRSPLLPTSPTNVGDNPNQANTTGAASFSASLLTACPLVIQACGLLLAQLPTAFHGGFYSETARIIKESWWVTDQNRSPKEMDAVFGQTLWDPTWAVQDEMSSVLGNTLALLHAFSANLPFEWLEGMHSVVTLQRPICSVAHLRLAFRIVGPLLPRLVISRSFFAKTLALLFAIIADVFGRNSVVSPNCEATEISDLVDFLHHAVLMEVQGPSSAVGKPRPETLVLCSKAVERLRPDLQHLFRHLSADSTTSIYAATHPKMAQVQQQAQQAMQAQQQQQQQRPQSTIMTVI